MEFNRIQIHKIQDILEPEKNTRNDTFVECVSWKKFLNTFKCMKLSSIQSHHFDNKFARKKNYQSSTKHGLFRIFRIVFFLL